jgi:transcriptional regulator with XRE-family HTH domain
MFSDLEVKYPALAEGIQKAKQNGISDEDIESYVTGQIDMMKLADVPAREIGEKLGVTAESQNRFIALKEAKKNSLIYEATGLSPKKAADAAYIAERVGLNPGLVLQNYDAFSKWFESNNEVSKKVGEMGLGNVLDSLTEERVRPTKPIPDAEKRRAFEGILPQWTERAMIDFAAGGLSIYTSLGSWVNRLFDNSTFQRHLEDVEDMVLMTSPEDPNFLDHVARGFGSMGAFILVGSLVGAGAGVLTGVSPSLANIIGAGTMATMEASVEAEETYRRAYELTKDKTYASKSATVAFMANLPISFISDKLAFFTEGSGALGGALRAIVTQAPEESFQSLISDTAVFGDVRNLNWKQALYEGAVAIPAAGVFGSVGGIQLKAEQVVSARAQEIMESAKTEMTALGITEDNLISEQVIREMGDVDADVEVGSFQDTVIDEINTFRESAGTMEQADMLQGAKALAQKLIEDLRTSSSDLFNTALEEAGITQEHALEAATKYIINPTDAPESLAKFINLQLFGQPKAPAWLDKPIGELVGEYEALKQGMKKAEKASKEGFRQGKREQKVVQDEKVQAEVDKRKQLRANLAVKRKMQQALKEIKTAQQKALGGKEKARVRSDFARAILDITEIFDWKTRTEADKKNLDTFRAQVMHELQVNPDVAQRINPKELMKVLKRNYKDLTLKELFEIRDTVKELVKAGTELETQRVEAIKMERQKIIDDTVQRLTWNPKRIRNIVNERLNDLGKSMSGLAKDIGVTEGELASVLKGKKRPDNAFINKLAKATELQAMDILEGEDPKGVGMVKKVLRGYDSWFTRFNRLGEIIGGKGSQIETLLNKKVNEAVNNNLRQLDTRYANVADALESVGMKLSDLKEKVEVVDPRTKKRLKLTVAEAIGIYIFNKNQEARDAVTFGNGISEEGQVAVIAKLTEAHRKLGDLAMKEVGSNYSRTADAYYANTGLILDNVPEYFRMFRNMGDELDIAQAMEQDRDFRSGMKRTRGKRGHTMDRKTIRPDSQLAIDTDFYNVWLRTINEQEQYIHFYGLGQEIQAVIGDRDVLKGLNNKFGENMVKELEQYIKGIVNPMFYYQGESLARGLRVLRNHYALSVLAGNLLSVARQPFSFAYYVPYSNAIGTAKALARMASNPMEASKFIYEKSPQVKHRAMTIEMREIQRYKEMKWGKVQGTLNHVIGKTIMLQRIADMAAVKMGWLMVYESEIARGASEQDAAMFADDVTNRTQPQAQTKDLNRAMTQVGAPGEIMRMILAFQNQLQQNYNILIHDVPAEVEAQNYTRAVGLVGTTLAQSFAMGLLAYKALPDWDDAEDTVKYILEIFRNLPLMHPVIEGYIGFSYGGIGQLTGIQREAGQALRDTVRGEGVDAVEHLARMGGYLTGTPIVATRNVARFWDSGDVADLFGGRKGKKKKKDKYKNVY